MVFLHWTALFCEMFLSPNTHHPQNSFFVILSNGVRKNNNGETERLTADGAALVCACQGFVAHPLL